MTAEKFLILIMLCSNLVVAVQSIGSAYEKFIHFMYYNKHSEPVFFHNQSIASNNTATNCSPPNGKVAVIVHGWREGCFTPWVLLLVKNLNVHRGGCIICMDYNEYARHSYYGLVGHFDGIAEVLANQLRHLQRVGFRAQRMFLFGFSYGAQLVLEAGRRFGEQQLHQIDVCEPAGPGFDRNATFQRQNRPQASAQNVQCVHTSYDKGTAVRACHQNWNMGHCGWSQAAAGAPPFGSHGMCPYLYVSAFENRFRAVERPAECPMPAQQHNETEMLLQHPNMLAEGYFMGYDESRSSNVTGEFFANTYRKRPFNVDAQHDSGAGEDVVGRLVIGIRLF